MSPVLENRLFRMFTWEYSSKVMMNASEMKFLEENWLTLSSKKRREYLRQDIGIIFQNGQHSIDPYLQLDNSWKK